MPILFSDFVNIPLTAGHDNLEAEKYANTLHKERKIVEEKFLTVDEVAELLMVRKPHVFRWIRLGQLIADKSDGTCRITEKHLRDFMNTPDGRTFAITWDRLAFDRQQYMGIIGPPVE
jgi:excisionase family DNA binding protein